MSARCRICASFSAGLALRFVAAASLPRPHRGPMLAAQHVAKEELEALGESARFESIASALQRPRALLKMYG